jgi:hypothetical protein
LRGPRLAHKGVDPVRGDGGEHDLKSGHEVTNDDPGG